MTSSRPYLVRAMYQWIVDNDTTPHLLVDANVASCMVPLEHVKDGKIVLNVAPMAISGLTLGDEAVTFSARFSGKSHNIYVPVNAVLAIYARENGQGMMFSEDENPGNVSGGGKGNDGDGPDPGKPRPSLRVVK